MDIGVIRISRQCGYRYGLCKFKPTRVVRNGCAERLCGTYNKFYPLFATGRCGAATRYSLRDVVALLLVNRYPLNTKQT